MGNSVIVTLVKATEVDMTEDYREDTRSSGTAHKLNLICLKRRIKVPELPKFQSCRKSRFKGYFFRGIPFQFIHDLGINLSGADAAMRKEF